MLRQKDGSEKDEEKGKEGAKELAKGVSKTAEEWKKPVSVFASLKQAAAKTPEKGALLLAQRFTLV